MVRFLRGARRLYHPRPPSMPPWDLALVLKALSLPPFEPLASITVKELSLKTALLLALASAKCTEDLIAFSVDGDCICFGPGACSVTLRPRWGYVPESLSPLKNRSFLYLLYLPSHQPHRTLTLRALFAVSGPTVGLAFCVLRWLY